MLDPYKQACIRSAGTAGHGIFSACADASLVPICAHRVEGLTPDGLVHDMFPMARASLQIPENSPDENYKSDGEALMEKYEVVCDVNLVFCNPHHPSVGTTRQYSYSTAQRFIETTRTAHTVTFKNSHSLCSGVGLGTNGNYLVHHLNMGMVGFSNSNFCTGWKCLQTVTFDPMSFVESIGPCFLMGCSVLRSVDLCVLQNIKMVSNNFLKGCCSLKAINLAPLSNVTHLGNGFFQDCLEIEHLDLSPLARVTEIGYGFLGGCRKLTDIDLNAMRQISRIAEGFLRDCSSLQRVDISEMAHLKHVGWNFLSGCTNVHSVNVPGSLPSHRPAFSTWMFMEQCKLPSISLPTFFGVGTVTSVGDNFLAGCEAVEIDFSSFENVHQIGNGFMVNSKNLKRIHLPMKLLISVGSGFCEECTALESFTTTRADPWMTVGPSFLSNCTSLKTVELAVLNNPCKIGQGLLAGSPMRSVAADAGVVSNSTDDDAGTFQSYHDEDQDGSGQRSRKCCLL